MFRYLAVAAAGAAMAAAPWAGGGAIVDLPGFRANSLPRADDVIDNQQPVQLPFTINFFGQQFNQVFPNINGSVTFTAPLPIFTPDPLLSDHTAIVAPFSADWDTSLPANPAEPIPNQVTYGVDNVNGHQAFGVDWINIGYSSAHDDKLNSAQLLLIDRSDTGAGNFDIEFNFDKIQWETGDLSGGVEGLGGDSARAGYSDGVSAAHSFELPGSALNGAFLDGGPNALATNNSNSNVPGRYVFESRGGSITPSTGPSPVALPAALWAGLGTMACAALAAGRLRARKRRPAGIVGE